MGVKMLTVISYKKSIVFPETGKSSNHPFDIKSFVRNIFHLNPEFAIFCADRIISADPNSAEAKYLAIRYQINRGQDIDMPVHPSVKVCTHIKVTGVQCGSPALRGEQFCYFHQRMMRGVQIPTNCRLHPIALVENEEAIQSSLMEIINALARNTIDFRRAELILKALYIAVKNSRRARFDNHSGMVQQVPDYPSEPRVPRPIYEPTVTVAAIETNPLKKELPSANENDGTKENAGAPSLSRPVRQGGVVDSGVPIPQAPEKNSVDPTDRKPPARAGLPEEKKKAAAIARGARAGR
jgi:hypothetical protein